MQSGWPMPFANTGLAAPNNFTNSAGIFDWTSGNVTTTLSGRYVRIGDTCGAISATGAGNVALGGTNGQHDCTTPGHAAAPATRRPRAPPSTRSTRSRRWPAAGCPPTPG